MAGELQDPLSLNSWEDAFSHPIPNVRKLEQQLRRHADENREKLRTLVGVSYRDLLGTAERIIDMDQQMRGVEIILGQTGQKCNAKAVGTTSTSFEKLQAENASWKQDRNALASQLYILEDCPVVITRILRRKGSLLLAAKLLLLSRLIHKTLSQRHEAPALVDSLRDRLATLRVKLLRAIDKRFADPQRDVAKLVDDMCAFSLATSSTPTDVLQHFLTIRLRAIQWHLAQDDDTKTHAIKAMRLLLTSLRSSQVIFPKQLSDSLVRLKDLPLIKQADVQSVSELQLGVHARWLTDELQNYTPWPRHDELQKSEADKIVKSWAKTAQKAFVAGLTQALGKVVEFDEILGIRQRLFEAWPWTDNRLPGLHSADIVDELREAFNDRMTVIIEMQVDSLRTVCSSTRELLGQSVGLATHKPLWSAESASIDTGAGGQRFKNAILASYNGLETSEFPPLLAFDKWITSIKQIQTDLKKMRDAHWEDELGEDDDEMDSRQTLLSEDDPRTLGVFLDDAMQARTKTLLTEFRSIVQKEESNSSDGPLVAVTLLRVLREISKRAALQDKLIADVAMPLITSKDLIQPLHQSISATISANAGTALSKSLLRLQKAPTLASKVLWEGKPPLPVQPHAMTFKLLKVITAGMADLGADLWSEAAVYEIKQGLSEVIAKHVKEALTQLSAEESPSPKVNGTSSHTDDKENNETTVEDGEETNGAEEHVVDSQVDDKQLRQDKLTQLVMDLAYLGTALSSKSQASTPLRALIEQAASHAEIGEAEKARLNKGAADYWKRTYLLFALLVPSA